MPSPVTITGNFFDITGVADATASVTFTLVNFGNNIPSVSGVGMLSDISVTAVCSGGTFSINLYGNDVINPAGTYYQVKFLASDGSFVAELGYQFLGSGTFDLSQIIPLGNQVVAQPQPNSAIPQIFTPLAHRFLTGMNALGQFSTAQPAFSDISGTAAASQLPTPTASTLGGVKSLAIVSHNFLTSIGTDGAPTAAQPAFTDVSGTASLAQIPSLPASQITSGQIALARGGTGADLSATGGTSQVLKQSSAGAVITVGQLAFSDISGAASTAQIPNLDASKITSGTLALARGGTSADLSATGGTSQVLKQVSLGAAITVGQLAASDLSNGTTGSGAVVLATSPTLTTPTLGVATATSINKLAITVPSTSATLTIANGKTLTANNSLTLAGTDSTTQTFPASPPTGGVLAYGVPSKQIFTGNGTFTIPTGVTAVKVIVIGGGGAGGGGSVSNFGTGGNSGGLGVKWLTGLTPGNTLAVTVGGGGTGASATTGGSGTASSVASGTQTITTISATGGAGGTGPGGTGNVPTAGTGGDLNYPGNPGSLGSIQAAGNSLGGNGAVGPLSVGAGLAGFGSAAGNAAAANTGSGGGGAGGGSGNSTGGNGGSGVVIFEWVA